uniref:Uncharacterized protein n=1 Tax=Rhizophora mucronata TaxID=61149 RepID=A0A2P2PAZ2_RHIMU
MEILRKNGQPRITLLSSYILALYDVICFIYWHSHTFASSHHIYL